MAKKSFTPEDIERLKCSPYIKSVSEDSLRVSDIFREMYYKRRSEGLSGTAIFKECGIGPDVIGEGRVSGLAHRMNRFDSYEDYLNHQKAVTERKFLNQSEEIDYLRHQLLLTQQENDFLKKNIDLERKHRTP